MQHKLAALDGQAQLFLQRPLLAELVSIATSKNWTEPRASFLARNKRSGVAISVWHRASCG